MSSLVEISQHLHYPDDLGQAQRLFHGRGHAYKGLSHVTVDWLPPVILVTLFAPETLVDVEKLADDLLTRIPAVNSVQLQLRYEKSGPVSVVRGDSVTQIMAAEDDLKFQVTLGQARNTGLFLDMKNGRRWVRTRSKDQRVLNLFAYTCGFSVAAIAGGARSVLNIDMSSPALSRGRDNHRLNHQPLDRVGFEKLDIFKSFGRLKKRGPFDLLICDPPTFQKGSVDIARDYPRILRRLDQFMAPGATLMLCLNAPELPRGFLVDHLAECAPDYVLVDEIRPPEVYAEAQNKGLKTLVFRGR